MSSLMRHVLFVLFQGAHETRQESCLAVIIRDIYRGTNVPDRKLHHASQRQALISSFVRSDGHLSELITART
jgi:hypothetical protein